MGLLDKLTSPGQGSTLSQFDGATPGKYGVSPGKASRLHYTYSINDIPHMTGMPTPSILDLDGVTPVGYQAPEVGIPLARLLDTTN